MYRGAGVALPWQTQNSGDTTEAGAPVSSRRSGGATDEGLRGLPFTSFGLGESRGKRKRYLRHAVCPHVPCILGLFPGKEERQEHFR